MCREESDSDFESEVVVWFAVGTDLDGNHGSGDCRQVCSQGHHLLHIYQDLVNGFS